MAALLAEHYHMSETFMLQVLETNWHDFLEVRWLPALPHDLPRDSQFVPYNQAYLVTKLRGKLGVIQAPRILLDTSLWASLQIFHDVDLNVMQRANLINGRDSRIARLRGDTLTKIQKAMQLGFDTFRRNVHWKMAIKQNRHLAALHVLHKNLNADVPELREKIVHLALFR